MTPVGGTYDAIYLCSALVLPERRRQGVALDMTVDAVRQIKEEHPIESLFVWTFSQEGERLAAMVAKATGVPLFKMKHA